MCRGFRAHLISRSLEADESGEIHTSDKKKKEMRKRLKPRWHLEVENFKSALPHPHHRVVTSVFIESALRTELPASYDRSFFPRLLFSVGSSPSPLPSFPPPLSFFFFSFSRYSSSAPVEHSNTRGQTRNAVLFTARGSSPMAGKSLSLSLLLYHPS